MLASFIGCAGWPVFYPVNMLGLYRTKVGTQVLGAAESAGPSVIATCCVAVTTYVILGFVNFWFFAASGMEMGNDCTSVYSCFVDTWGSSAAFFPENLDMEAAPITVLFSLFAAFTGTKLFCTFVVQCQFVMAFNSINSQRMSRVNDQKFKCIMCSIDRHAFEKDGRGWQDHVTADHDPFNYLAFFYYLWKKDEMDFTGMETYVLDKMGQDDPSFLPISQAMVLTKTALKTKEAQNAQAAALADANTKLDNVDARFDQHEAKLYNMQAQLESVLGSLTELNRKLDSTGNSGGAAGSPGSAGNLEGSAGSGSDSVVQLKAQVKQLKDELAGVRAGIAKAKGITLAEVEKVAAQKANSVGGSGSVPDKVKRGRRGSSFNAAGDDTDEVRKQVAMLKGQIESAQQELQQATKRF